MVASCSDHYSVNTQRLGDGEEACRHNKEHHALRHAAATVLRSKKFMSVLADNFIRLVVMHRDKPSNGYAWAQSLGTI